MAARKKPARGKSGSIATSMEAIIGHLRRLRRPVVERLAPPASSDQIANAESEFGFKLTGELRALYARCNGTSSKPKDLPSRSK